MINTKGCEPLAVEFIDESTDVSSFFINYGDGSKLDTTKIGNRLGVNPYVVTAQSQLSQAFEPSLVV